jgi:hypothetical protein
MKQKARRLRGKSFVLAQPILPVASGSGNHLVLDLG